MQNSGSIKMALTQRKILFSEQYYKQAGAELCQAQDQFGLAWLKMQILGKYWANIEKYWENIGKILGKYSANIGQILGKYWANIRQILGNIGQILGKYWAILGNIGQILATLYPGPRPTNSTQLELLHCSMLHILPIPHN